MKKIFSLLVICIAFVFASCEQETFLEEDNSVTPKSVVNNQSLRPGGEIDPCCGEENMFERQLHWFAYLSAEVFTANAAARGELNALANADGSDIIPIEDLIGPDSQTLAFNQAFYDLLVWYYDDWTGWPNTNNSTPPFPPDTGGPPSTNQGNYMANLFYDNMLNHNCIELYLPKGIDVKGMHPSATSTAHPLTRSGANEGIKFTYSPLINDYYSTEEVINQQYVLSNKNIMVARPHRYDATPAGPDCTYVEYADINFTQFLN